MVDFFRILDTERHVVFCPMNFVADTYKGCPHACWYCYAPSARRRGFEESFKSFRDFKPRLKDNDFEGIEVALKGGDVSGVCRKGQETLVAEALQHKHPLRIGSVSEPFGLPLEKDRQHTYRILEKLAEYDYPYVVCTKSPLVATPRYVNLIKSTKKAAVQISLISPDDNLLGYLESRLGGRTPSAISRLEAMRKLANEEIFTICRIQPMIPQVTETGMRELIFALADAGVKHVIVEFLWFPLAHVKPMGAKLKEILDAYCKDGGTVGDDLKRCNNNLYEFYMSFPDHEATAGRLFFSKKEIARIMPKFAKIVSEASKEFSSDMTFGSGNEETQYLNSTENCCGVDRLPGFSGYPTCAIQMMLKIAGQKGKVTLEDMKPHYNPDMSKFEQVWKKRRKDGRYFIENRVFKLRARPTDDPSEVEYVYDETAMPD